MKHNTTFKPLAHMVDGSLSGLHIHDIEGALGDGPTLGICGAVHGNEHTGTHTILDFVRALCGTPFRGA